jgi:hypothetical protein
LLLRPHPHSPPSLRMGASFFRQRSLAAAPHLGVVHRCLPITLLAMITWVLIVSAVTGLVLVCAGVLVVARFPPQTAKRWPDYCHKPRNQNLCGEIRLKQACGRHSLGRRLFKLPPDCAGGCRSKGKAHDRSPGYRACHRWDGNTSNDHGDGARLKVGILLVAVARNCPSERPGRHEASTATTMKTWMRREQAFV